MSEKTEKSPVAVVIDEKFRHKMHGKPGSHEDSHKSLGGARARINLGDPEEMKDDDGESA